MNLYEFYTSPIYTITPEIEAIKQHTTGSALFAGNYSAAALAPHFEESFAAVPDQNVLFACQTDNDADIRYAGANLTHLPYPDESFDTVVSAYNGLHKNPKKLAELKRVSKNTLLIIEADMSSEYVQILQQIDSQTLPDVSILLDMLGEYNVIEESIESHYSFASKEEFAEYFQTELNEHEQAQIDGKTLTQYYQTTVGERAHVFICTQ